MRKMQHTRCIDITDFKLNLGDLRSLVRLRIEWIPNLERSGFLSEARQEFIIDGFLDEDT